MKEKNLIGILDCNNFFVSCERLFRPDLRKQPVLVLSSNDGCVVARSQEVKDLGIPMGVPYFEVKDIIKNNKVAVFSSNFTLYRDISMRVMEILKAEVGNIEQYSIDESFFNFVDKQPNDYLFYLRDEIERKSGIPVALGAGKTKTIAKYASEMNKKTTKVGLLEGLLWQKSRRDIPMADIWGVGYKTAKLLSSVGITTVGDFCSLDRRQVKQLLGLVGLRLYDELMEESAHSVFTVSDSKKSMVSSRSFAEPIYSLTDLRQAVAYHTENVALNLRRQNSKASVVRVMLLPSRHGSYFLRGGVLEAHLVSPTSDTREILKVALTLLSKLYEVDVPYKKAGVGLSNVCEVDNQTNLFFDHTRSDSLMSLVDNVNKRHQGSLFFGRTMAVKDQRWLPQRSDLSPAYTTDWRTLKKVKT